MVTNSLQHRHDLEDLTVAAAEHTAIQDVELAAPVLTEGGDLADAQAAAWGQLGGVIVRNTRRQGVAAAETSRLLP